MNLKFRVESLFVSVRHVGVVVVAAGLLEVMLAPPGKWVPGAWIALIGAVLILVGCFSDVDSRKSDDSET